jgi:hypothetical protein
MLLSDMRKFPHIFLAVLFIFAFPAFVFGADEKQPQWYEIIGGVLAIPATIIGVVYSYILLKKTNLESKKIQLEIKEKEQVIVEQNIVQSEQVKEIVKPFFRTQLVHQIILRYIILELISRLFSLFAGGYSFLLSGISVVTYNNMTSETSRTIFGVVITFLQFLPQLGFALIFIFIGYPLFKDVNKTLGIDLKGIFFSSSKRKVVE